MKSARPWSASWAELGTYVKLMNGETAVVMRRGVKPAEPLVAAVC